MLYTDECTHSTPLATFSRVGRVEQMAESAAGLLTCFEWTVTENITAVVLPLNWQNSTVQSSQVQSPSPAIHPANFATFVGEDDQIRDPNSKLPLSWRFQTSKILWPGHVWNWSLSTHTLLHSVTSTASTLSLSLSLSLVFVGLAKKR